MIRYAEAVSIVRAELSSAFSFLVSHTHVGVLPRESLAGSDAFVGPIDTGALIRRLPRPLRIMNVVTIVFGCASLAIAMTLTAFSGRYASFLQSIVPQQGFSRYFFVLPGVPRGRERLYFLCIARFVALVIFFVAVMAFLQGFGIVEKAKLR